MSVTHFSFDPDHNPNDPVHVHDCIDCLRSLYAITNQELETLIQINATLSGIIGRLKGQEEDGA